MSRKPMQYLNERVRPAMMGLLTTALLAGAFGDTAEAAGRGGAGTRAANGGRLAQSSVSGANRAVSNNRYRGQINAGNRNNVNIGNDVNIDIDQDHHWNDWNDHHHPIAAGIVIGTMAVTTAAVVGSYYYALPSGCTTVYRNGVSYYYCGSVYYSRTWYGNDVVYVVVNP